MTQRIIPAMLLYLGPGRADRLRIPTVIASTMAVKSRPSTSRVLTRIRASMSSNNSTANAPRSTRIKCAPSKSCKLMPQASPGNSLPDAWVVSGAAKER